MTEYSLERLQGESKFQHMKRVCIDKLNKEHNIDWLEIKDMFEFEHSAESLRKYSTAWKLEQEAEELEALDREDLPNYKETTEILSNGSQKSDKLIKMSLEQSKDVNYLLEAHGFSKEDWELVSARNNIWNVNSKSQGVQTLYSSKITVKPKINRFDIDKFVEMVQKDTKAINVNRIENNSKKFLEIPLFDMHFGVADLDYYMNTINKIHSKINSQEWDEILFVIGQDLLHNDGFEGKTTSGTPIEKVNMEKAWEDADTFYSNLITLALTKSNKVHLVYSNGNHDKGISYGFAKMLEAKFPQAISEMSVKQRKAFVYKDVFVGLTHGDKGNARIEKNFYSEFGKEIAVAKVVEVHSGHIHHEVTKDNLGITVRSLSTGAKTDDWHYDNGFLGAHKHFQIFEYSSDSLDAIYYV